MWIRICYNFPTFSPKIREHLKHLSLIGNKIKYVSLNYVKEFASIESIDMRAQRVPVNCTMLTVERNIMRSDCLGTLVNDSAKGVIKGINVVTLPSEAPPICFPATSYVALFLSVIVMFKMIAPNIYSILKRRHPRNQEENV